MGVIEALREALGPQKVATDEATLQARRHDYWALSAIRDHRGDPAPRPACVVRPGSVADVQAALRAAAGAGAPVIPFGLGSGVVGGVIAWPDAVILDMSAMNRVRSVDTVDLMAAFDAGVRGTDAEAAVAANGLTIGHWPQSVAVSSVGGWVATRVFHTHTLHGFFNLSTWLTAIAGAAVLLLIFHLISARSTGSSRSRRQSRRSRRFAHR